MPLSFEEFRNIWRSQIGAGQPAKYDTYKKFKHLSASDCETAIKQLICEKRDESETTLTPKIKQREYLEQMPVGKLRLSALALDRAESLHIVVFERQSAKAGTETVYRDSLRLEKNETSGRLVTANDIIKAYTACQWNANDDSIFNLIQGELLQVFSTGSIASLMVIPSFVESMRRKLRCEAKDDLVAVPFTSDMIYATKSSSPLGCCMLGDFCDALGATRNIADYITSVPYRLASVDKSQSVEALLSQNKPPCLWEYYPYWGQKPNLSIASSDGKVRFPIPGSAAQADEFLVELQAGKQPTVVLAVVDDETTNSFFGNCAQCFQVDKLKKCSRCNLIPYCSKECQRKHWKLHKLQCKHAAK
jgi:hypothetical protein